jgi:hypothetical protein
MGKSRRGAVERAIPLIYLTSFFLPVGEAYGWVFFLAALLYGIFMPLVLLYWIANPLLWWGLAALHRGRFARAGVFGGVASVLAALPIGNPILHRQHGIPTIPWAYYAWFASMILLASAGLVLAIREWVEQGELGTEKPSRLEGLLELD